MFTDLKYEESTAVLSLNRPRTNSLDLTFLREIYEYLCAIDSMQDIHTVVLASSLPFGFSSGLDLGSLFTAESREKTGENICDAVELVSRINKIILLSKKIFIAAVSGPVIGSGASIAICCDLCVASTKTWFWIPEPQYGGLAADGVIDVLCGKIGASRAVNLLITNDRVNAADAYEWGLIYKLVPAEQLERITYDLAKRLSGYSVYSLGFTKERINNRLVATYQQERLYEFVNSAESFDRLKYYVNGKKT